MRESPKPRPDLKAESSAQPDIGEEIAKPKRGPRGAEKGAVDIDKYERMSRHLPAGSLRLDWSKIKERQRMRKIREEAGIPHPQPDKSDMEALRADIVKTAQASQRKKKAVEHLQKSEGVLGDIEAWKNIPTEPAAPAAEVKIDESVVRRSWIDRLLTKISDKLTQKSGEAMVRKQDEAEQKIKESDQRTAAGLTAAEHRQKPPATHRFEDWSELGAVPTADEVRHTAAEAKTELEGEKMMAGVAKAELEEEAEETMSPAAAIRGEESAKKAVTQAKRERQHAETGEKNIRIAEKRLEEVESQLKNLVEIVKSIKIGWFSHLKIDSDGYITNLPGGTDMMVLENLVKEKERLGAKGKIEEANKIVEQIEALEKYQDLLVQRDKLNSAL